MKVFVIAIAAIGIVTLSGCATVETLQATGGSRSDGMIAMSYSYGKFEQPKPRWDAALKVARDRCQNWGYSNAEKFGGSTRQCQSGDSYGCNHWLVTVKYQCTGMNR